MSKKDFQLVADAIAKCHGSIELATMMADMFQVAYPRFDRERFLKACGIWGRAAAQL